MKIAFIGDIVVKNKDVCLSNELKKVFDNCDFCICNFEAPILNNKNCIPLQKAGPNIFQTEKGIDLLKHIGVNLVSLANNHILDYGKKALKDTIDTLKENEFNIFGAGFSFQDAYQPYVLKSNKESIAFIACSQAEFGVFKSLKDSSGYAWANHSLLNKLIEKNKRRK